MWVPKMVFSNQADRPFIVASLMTLSSTGEVVYRRRIKVDCAENFLGLKHFPFDHHTILIQMESYGFSADEVLLHPWVDDRVEMSADKPLRRKLEGITSGIWKIYSFDTISSVHKSRNYARDCFFEGRLYIRRKKMMPLTEIVFPLMLTVALTLSSTLYRLQALDVRTNIAVVGLFTTLMYLYVVKADLPPISFLTWTHYYMVLCLVIAGAVMGQVALCHWLDPSGEGADKQIEEAAMGGLGLSDRLRYEADRKEGKTPPSPRGHKYQRSRGKSQYGHGSSNPEGASAPVDGTQSPQAMERQHATIGRRASFVGADGIHEALLSEKKTCRLSAAFDAIDADHSGELDVEELMIAFQKLHIRTTRAGVEKIIADTKDHFLKLEGSDGKGSDSDSEDADELSLSRAQFVWAATHHTKLNTFSHSRSLTVCCFSLNESHVPAIDRWCSRILPCVFLAVLTIMLLVEVPNMRYTEPALIDLVVGDGGIVQ